MIKSNCNHCGNKLESPDECEGQTYNCPTCNGLIQIPYTKSTQTRILKEGEEQKKRLKEIDRKRAIEFQYKQDEEIRKREHVKREKERVRLEQLEEENPIAFKQLEAQKRTNLLLSWLFWGLIVIPAIWRVLLSINWK